jgi:hypothetical protein
MGDRLFMAIVPAAGALTVALTTILVFHFR